MDVALSNQDDVVLHWVALQYRLGRAGKCDWRPGGAALWGNYLLNVLTGCNSNGRSRFCPAECDLNGLNWVIIRAGSLLGTIY
ncbi:hypothetical protein JCM31271_00690 [Halorubrum trueperi]